MKSQSGNVLFLILIAVALFTALSYAVTSSTRGGGSSIAKDKARANAATIIQYTTSLRNAVMRMKLSNGCSDTTLDFNNGIFKTNGGTLVNTANSNAPADKRCNLFDANGGNMIPVIASQDSIDPNNLRAGSAGNASAGSMRFTVLQFKGIGTDGAAGTVSANDIALYYSYLNKDTCLAINDILGVPNPNGDAPLTSYTGGFGNYSNGSLAATGIYDQPETNGLHEFCTFEATYGYFYYAIIVAR